MLPTAALNAFNQPSCETLESELVSSVSAPRSDVITVTRRWILTVQTVTLCWDAARALLRANRAAYWIYHLTQSVTFVSGVLLLSLFPQFCNQPTKCILKKKKKKRSLLLVISRRVDTHDSLQKAAAFFLTVVAVWSCATSPLKHEVYFCTFSKLFVAKKPPKKTDSFWYAACVLRWQIGEFICTLKWHRVCSTEPESHPPMTSASLFFFFFF